MEIEKFDYLLIGTDIQQCALSALLSRDGKKVLHIDKNNFYGSQYGTISIQELLDQNVSVDLELRVCNYQIKQDSALQNNLRNIQVDLVPQLIYCNGSLLEHAVEFNIGEYLEFNLVRNHSLLMINESGDTFLRVPQTKEDVFNDNSLSLVDKRRLMKFFESCQNLQLDSSSSEVKFYEWLQQFKFSEQYQKLISDSILLRRNIEDVTLQEGIDQCRKYIQSIGKYGKSPFLYPLYGISEIIQAYSRVSAVNGTVFVLGCKDYQFKGENVVEIKVHDGSLIEFEVGAFISSKRTELCKLYRAVFLIQGQIKILNDEEDSACQFLVITSQSQRNVYCLIQSSLNQCCPKGYTMINLWSFEHQSSSQFKDCFERVMKLSEQSMESVEVELYFEVVVPQTDLIFDLDEHVKSAKDQFQSLQNNTVQ